MKNQTAHQKNRSKVHVSKSALKSRKRQHRRRKPNFSRADRFTCLWLILFFPLGLMRMWKDSCRWKKSIKYAVSGLYVALAAAIVVVPSPYRKTNGSVEIVANDPEVEIYGPAAPETMVNGYTSTMLESVVTDATSTSDENVTVYASEDGRCYHLGDCKFAYASAKRLTVYEAYFLGYKPCGNCNPPVYNPVTGKVGTSTETETAADETAQTAEIEDSVLEDTQEDTTAEEVTDDDVTSDDIA